MKLYVIFISEYLYDTLYTSTICRANSKDEAKEHGEYYIKKNNLKGKVQFILEQNINEYLKATELKQ